MQILQRLFRRATIRAAPLPLLLLAGCAVGPDYRKPEPETSATWQAPLPHGENAGNLNNWWRQFDDPVLSDLIEAAETDSPTLTQAWASIERARATLKSGRSGIFPSVFVGGSVSRGNQQTQGPSLTTDSNAPVTETRSASLDASWELDVFGKIRRSMEASNARIEARVEDWHDARVSLAAEVATTYVQYRACGQLADVYTRELASITETERATSVSVRAGFGAPSDAALARASLASTKSTLVSQQAQCELLVKSLANLTAIEEPALRERIARGSVQVPQPAALEVPSVPADLLRQRPDLASLERELAAASAEIGVAQADYYPSLSLSGLISVSATSLANFPTTWSWGPSLSAPLFDGGARGAALASARADYISAFAAYRQGVRNIVTEVEQALVNLDSSARRYDEAERAAREYRSYFDSTETYWRAGGASLLTLEEARRSALSAELQRVTLQRDRVEYWIALYKALGGGWQSGTPASAPDALAESRAPDL